MRDFTLSHVSDAVLLRELAALVAQDRITTAILLAHIAEVDSRRLYVPAGYPSMHAYCVEELRLSQDAASRRIQAARAARRFPALFPAVAEGRLHLTAVCLLSPHLTTDNVGELIQAATHRRKAEIEELLARCFPIAAAQSSMRAIPAHALAHVDCDLSHLTEEDAPGQASSQGNLLAPWHVAPTPLERVHVHVTFTKNAHEKLRYAQALLSHVVPTGDVAQLLERALDALIDRCEKRKFGGVSRSRVPDSAEASRRSAPGRRSKARSRYVPVHVRRAVWERDRGQCTFLSAAGRRCAARRFLEFDHVEPVARGGRATIEGMRLRCRAHNQYEAERVFGAGFMDRKRHEARLAAHEAQARAAAREEAAARDASARERAISKQQAQEVLAGLRSLGCRSDEARRPTISR